jgi:hypothetical protein
VALCAPTLILFDVTVISVTEKAVAFALINKNTAQRVNVTDIVSAGVQSVSGDTYVR